jgi:Holliday junction resolvase RusA-like endonuclease
MRLRFIIPGPPKGKDRPRTAPGQSRPYTPKETVEAEKRVRALFKQRFPDHQPFTGPVMIRFTAVFEVPKSFNAKLRQEALAGRLYATKKPDKDNLEKLIADALNGVAWVDDAQLQGGGVKRYGSPERVEVDLEFIEGHPVTPNEDRRAAKIKQAQLFPMDPPKRRRRMAR